MNSYMDYGNPMRRPGAAIRSQYSLPPTFKVGELPTPKAPEYQRQSVSVGVQPSWTGEKPNFMGFPATAAAVSGVIGGINDYRDTKEAQREQARRDAQMEALRAEKLESQQAKQAEKEAKKAEKEAAKANKPPKGGGKGGGKGKKNDQPVDSMGDPGAPSFSPNQPPQIPGQTVIDFDAPVNPFEQLSFNFNAPETPKPLAPISSTNQRRFASTRGKEAPTMSTPGMNPWQQKQERTGYEGPVVSEPNRGPMPTTNKGAPLLGPRNRRRR